MNGFYYTKHFTTCLISTEQTTLKSFLTNYTSFKTASTFPFAELFMIKSIQQHEITPVVYKTNFKGSQYIKMNVDGFVTIVLDCPK